MVYTTFLYPTKKPPEWRFFISSPFSLTFEHLTGSKSTSIQRWCTIKWKVCWPSTRTCKAHWICHLFASGASFVPGVDVWYRLRTDPARCPKLRAWDNLLNYPINSLKTGEETRKITSCASFYLREQKSLLFGDREARDHPLIGWFLVWCLRAGIGQTQAPSLPYE